MKRSLMLSHIQSLIIDQLREGQNYNAKEFTVKREHLPNLAGELLDMLEFQGMLPPFGASIKQRDILDKWSVNTGRKEMVRVIEQQWDEENV